MLSNPVKGFSGGCLNELGECACVITANQAMSADDIEEVFYLIFPSTFVILAVGSSLSGYELKVSIQSQSGLDSPYILGYIASYNDVCTVMSVYMCSV